MNLISFLTSEMTNVPQKKILLFYVLGSDLCGYYCCLIVLSTNPAIMFLVFHCINKIVDELKNKQENRKNDIY